MNMFKKIAVGTALAFFSLLVFFIATKQEAQDKSAMQKDDATLIKLGEMTEQQKRHSKLYARGEENEGKDLLAFGKDIKLTVTAPWGEAFWEGETKPSQDQFIQKLSCDSDAIVQAKVLSKASQLTENHRFVFTDYVLELSTVNKILFEPKLEIGTKIILTSPGGMVKVEGKTIDVKVKTDKRLTMGDSYVFFLKYLKDSASFRTVSGEGVFLKNGEEVTRYNDTNAPYLNMSQSRASLSSFINTSIQMCREQEK